MSTELAWVAHAARISAAWGKMVESIIATGHALIDAKADLEHDEFTAMVEKKLPFGPNTAQRLMKIANNKQLANPGHAQLLPPSWMTLVELTKLPDDVLAAALGDGTITAKMERKDVAALRAPSPPGMAKKSVASTAAVKKTETLAELADVALAIGHEPSGHVPASRRRTDGREAAPVRVLSAQLRHPARVRRSFLS
jgi:hypothetical protein